MTAVLVDTNVFARAASADQVQYSEAVQALKRLTRSQAVSIAPQVIYELWVVFTRPVSSNGFGWTTAVAEERLRRVTRFIKRLEDGPAVYHEWFRLVRKYAIAGKPAHDARLVAIMNVHKVDHLVTFNAADFARYSHLTVWTPSMVP